MANHPSPTVLTVKRSNTGSVIEPNLHDGLLTKIELLEGDEARLAVQGDNRAKFELTLHGLIRLRAANFCEGNIILDVIFHEGEACDPILLGELYRETSGKAFDSILKRIQNRELLILEIQPSYGCSLFALCKEITIYKI